MYDAIHNAISPPSETPITPTPCDNTLGWELSQSTASYFNKSDSFSYIASSSYCSVKRSLTAQLYWYNEPADSNPYNVTVCTFLFQFLCMCIRRQSQLECQQNTHRSSSWCIAISAHRNFGSCVRFCCWLFLHIRQLIIIHVPHAVTLTRWDHTCTSHTFLVLLVFPLHSTNILLFHPLMC